MTGLLAAPQVEHSAEYLAEDIGPSMLATVDAMIVLCTVFLVLHYLSRYLAGTPLGTEDFLLPFAWLANIALCVIDILMVKETGLGRHLAYVMATDPGKLNGYLKGVFLNELVHPFAVAIPKICVVLLYLRVFTNKRERIAAKILIAVILATWVAFNIATMFQCIPLTFNWDKSIPGGTCFDAVLFSQSSSVPNIVTDVAILVLPIRTVVALKISVGRKVGLIVIFLVGSIGIVASIIRTVVFFTTNFAVDNTYNTVALLRWTLLEPCMYLLAATSLSFKPLLRLVVRFLHLHIILTTADHTVTSSRLGSPNTFVRPSTATQKSADAPETTKLDPIVSSTARDSWEEGSWFEAANEKEKSDQVKVKTAEKIV
ncbi:hypothetical protein DM02DRAFT_581776 [Periconia macrospinosa]|uniref:Rhodopsin domain-containing protein n=1 Tax=Periconia macrospinosa TaxID=97972 RepID=A0A2V1EAJ9_9PLEO|nr:hypothetical protein DM02DRAFT_581776 [Periconia macrospinosa]